MRSKGVAISTASNWLNNCKSTLLPKTTSITHTSISYNWFAHSTSNGYLPVVRSCILLISFLISHLPINRVTFLIFAIACILAYIWSTKYVPETANVSLEDIDSLFRSSAGAQDAELRSEVCSESYTTDHWLTLSYRSRKNLG
jgi:hypothetical protein